MRWDIGPAPASLSEPPARAWVNPTISTNRSEVNGPADEYLPPRASPADELPAALRRAARRRHDGRRAGPPGEIAADHRLHRRGPGARPALRSGGHGAPHR